MGIRTTLIALSALAVSTPAFAAMSLSDGFETGSHGAVSGSGKLSDLPGQARTGKGYGLFEPFLKPGTLSVSERFGRKRGSLCTATVWVRPLGGGLLKFEALDGNRILAGQVIPVLVSGGDVANNFYQPYSISFRANGRPVRIVLAYDPQGVASSLRVDDLSVACR